MPLSEDEQRILQEMEQKLYEHDRAFVDRVRARKPRGGARPVRSSVVVFLAGFVIVLVSFRSTLVLATLGFFLMLGAALMFERGARRASAPLSSGEPPLAERTHPHADLGSLGKRLRSRFRSH